MQETNKGTPRLKTGLAEMLKGGVIMDVTDDAQARIAEAMGVEGADAAEKLHLIARKTVRWASASPR